MKIIALLSAALIAAPAFAAPSFMGITLNRPLGESVPEPCPASIVMPHAPLSHPCVLAYGMPSDVSVYGSPLGTFGVHLEGGNAVMITLHFAAESDPIASLEKRFGAPQRSESIAKQNQMGAPYIDRREEWDLDGLLITYDSVADRPSEGRIVAASKSYLASSGSAAAAQADALARAF